MHACCSCTKRRCFRRSHQLRSWQGNQQYGRRLELRWTQRSDFADISHENRLHQRISGSWAVVAHLAEQPRSGKRSRHRLQRREHPAQLQHCGLRKHRKHRAPEKHPAENCEQPPPQAETFLPTRSPTGCQKTKNKCSEKPHNQDKGTIEKPFTPQELFAEEKYNAAERPQFLVHTLSWTLRKFTAEVRFDGQSVLQTKIKLLETGVAELEQLSRVGRFGAWRRVPRSQVSMNWRRWRRQVEWEAACQSSPKDKSRQFVNNGEFVKSQKFVLFAMTLQVCWTTRHGDQTVRRLLGRPNVRKLYVCWSKRDVFCCVIGDASPSLFAVLNCSVWGAVFSAVSSKRPASETFRARRPAVNIEAYLF